MIDNIANPEKEEYYIQMIRYLDSIFYKYLDKEIGKSVRKERKPIDLVKKIIRDTEALSTAFNNKSNYIVYYC